MKYTIVKIDGMFAVRETGVDTDVCYVDRDSTTRIDVWYTPSTVRKYCLMETMQQAEALMKICIEQNSNNEPLNPEEV